MPASTLFAPCNIPGYTVSKLPEEPDAVEITLTYNTKTSFTPSFDHFEIEDDNEWVPITPKFIVKKKQLRTGINARVVNTLGVAGPVITIKNK